MPADGLTFVVIYVEERLVECTQLHKAIDTVYATYLPKIGRASCRERV